MLKSVLDDNSVDATPIYIQLYRWLDSVESDRTFRRFVVEVLSSPPYDIPTDEASILEDNSILLLDGLDELDGAAQSACLMELEKYVELTEAYHGVDASSLAARRTSMTYNGPSSGFQASRATSRR